MAARKHIRIALTPDDYAAFEKAKGDVEAATGIAMSDSMYALSVIRHDLRARATIDRMIESN